MAGSGGWQEGSAGAQEAAGGGAGKGAGSCDGPLRPRRAGRRERPRAPLCHAIADKAPVETTLLILREGEMCLKSKRDSKLYQGADMYTVFRRKLYANLRIALTRVAVEAKVEGTGFGVIRVDLERASDAARAIAACRQVFGIASVARAVTVPQNSPVEEIAATALPLIPATGSFRVLVNRSDKTYPVKSPELARKIAEAVLAHRPQLTVNLMPTAETTLSVDVRFEALHLDAARLPAVGGMPSETSGTAACLLSGGIDSPVATFALAARGVRVVLVAFDSAPYTGPATTDKIVALARQLAQYQVRLSLYMVPFADCQRAIVATAPDELRTVLYRRLMARIARRIAAREGGLAIATGEAVAQVASQTLENMSAIGAGGLVLRPLLGMDKTAIISLARRIGTFDVSNIQAPDSCIVFAPKGPTLNATVAVCEEAEAAYDPPMGDMAEAAFKRTVLLQGALLHIPGALAGLRTRGVFLGVLPDLTEEGSEAAFPDPQGRPYCDICEACGVRLDRKGSCAAQHFNSKRHIRTVRLARAVLRDAGAE